MRRWIGLSILLIIVLILAANWNTVNSLLEGGTTARDYPETLEYTITRSVQFSGSNYGFILTVPVPDDIVTLGGGYIQRIHNSTTIYSEGITLQEKEEREVLEESNSRNLWWTWELPQGSSGMNRVEKTHHVTSRTVRWSLDPSMVGTVGDILTSTHPSVVSMREKYLDEEWVIQPENPAIKAVADEMMKGANGNAYTIIRNSFLFMRRNFEYETDVQIEPKEAARTLDERRGDCDDQSALLASILRAAGIPAWLELGGMYDSVSGQWGGHAWLKVYVPMLDSNGIFDPENSGTADIDVVNDEFLFRSCYRYSEWESDGNGDNLKSYYAFITYWGSPSILINWETRDLVPSGRVVYITSDGEVLVPWPGTIVSIIVFGSAWAVVDKKSRTRARRELPPRAP